jgi:hypothetical protein
VLYKKIKEENTMAFTLGNHYIDEILYGVGEVDGELSYVLD